MDMEERAARLRKLRGLLEEGVIDEEEFRVHRWGVLEEVLQELRELPGDDEAAPEAPTS